jgi:light-regulated signal transduction histidine kinase (bacteriophytochrome)
MPQVLSESSIEAALEICAKEPVHIPGLIQPFGVVMGYDTRTDAITHISDNAGDILPQSSDTVLGNHLKNFFCKINCTGCVIQEHSSALVWSDPTPVNLK